jgi:hypothetical protein
MILRPAGLADCEILAFLHASCFPEEPWDAMALSQLLASPGMFALLACACPDKGLASGLAAGLTTGVASEPAGFVLARAIAGEAEIVTIAVDPAHQGAGKRWKRRVPPAPKPRSWKSPKTTIRHTDCIPGTDLKKLVVGPTITGKKMEQSRPWS